MSKTHRDITSLIHHPYTPPIGFEAPQQGVFKASTVYFPTVADMRQREWKDKSAYTYGLHGTPTTYTLEERLCTLEGGAQCVLVPSGLAALATVALALLKSGDELLLPDNAYGPNKALAEGELRHYGITHQVYDPMDPEDLARKIGPRTRLVWLEAPGSVSMEFPDLPEMVRRCQAQGVLCALDNTWGAGLAFKPFDLLGDAAGAGQRGSLAVDISAHALTKYPSGGGDVLMGSIITQDPALHLKIKLCHMRLGLGVAANDAETVLRSLPSIDLRYKAHDQTARALAAWWQAQPQCAQLLHPAFDGSPGHAHWQAVCERTPGTGLAAGLFSVMIDPRYSQTQVDAFCDNLKLFKIGYSWGGPVSLVVPYELGSMRQGWPAHLKRGTLVRFSTGLESAEDLMHDLIQATQAHLPWIS
ncbi:PLP-dependent transferase [Limnohabitans parvus]|uniref:Cystathionine beta-lyase n=1 Tax=Limnohabitans parvus II-B4 TaxID=1293052 RepID=A0A315EAA7_9BURK|nr:PLP-dependent transferase [Limnohabitans parvus]PUE52934.1 cystathionine beta-lyase [Limnohabitans parvus II-B4]